MQSCFARSSSVLSMTSQYDSVGKASSQFHMVEGCRGCNFTAEPLAEKGWRDACRASKGDIKALRYKVRHEHIESHHSGMF